LTAYAGEEEKTEKEDYLGIIGAWTMNLAADFGGKASALENHAFVPIHFSNPFWLS
jgi:hypothetical protein